MHELPLTKSIFKSVVARAESVNARHVNRVVLEIGILRDFIPEIVQKYWDYIAPGTIAEGARIEIRELNAAAICGQCRTRYTITRETIANTHCPACGYGYGTLVAGSELRLIGIEVEKGEKKEDNNTTKDIENE